MKNTLIISSFFPPDHGGIQNYIFNFAKRLPHEKIFILTDKNTNSLSFDNKQNFKIYRKSFKSPLRYIKLSSLDLLLKARRIINQNNIELLIAGHFFLPALTCYLLHRLTGIPYHIFTYGTEITELKNSSDLKRKYMHKILDQADKIYTISDYLKNILIENRVKEKIIIKIYPGVDTQRFTPKDNLLAKQHISNLLKTDLTDYNIILSLGRLVKRKGQDMVIKSLSNILIKFPKTKYLIVGDGPDREYLRNLVKINNLSNYVIFAGAPDNNNILDYYQACDIFSMPSRTLEKSQDVEGFGIVYLEAAACEKPVIAGKGGGVAEAVSEQTGIIVDSTNPDEIAKAIILLLENPHIAKKLGENGRQRAIKEFNWDKLAELLKINI